MLLATVSSQKYTTTMNSKMQNKRNAQKRLLIKQSPSKQDNALMLRPEYKGQVVTAMKIKGTPTILATAITSGVINQNISLNQGGLLFNFPARFITFTEYRIIKVKATVKCFSTQNPGIALMWFSEDDTTTPTSAKALDAITKQFNLADVTGSHSVLYVPHDPAQQTWTLVSSGNPIIGYFKIYTDATNFGAGITALNVAIVTYDVTVQFRGLI